MGCERVTTGATTTTAEALVGATVAEITWAHEAEDVRLGRGRSWVEGSVHSRHIPVFVFTFVICGCVGSGSDWEWWR